MLKVLYAIPCENFIVADNGVTSLISILEKVEAEIPSDAPDKIRVPLKWYFVTFWTRGDQDFSEPVIYEQRTAVIPPGETAPAIEPVVSFIVSNSHPNFRTAVNFNGFPLTKSGTTTVEVHLRKQGEERWKKYAEYFIVAQRTITEAKDANQTELGHANNEVTVKS